MAEPGKADETTRLDEDDIHIQLTYELLDASAAISRVKSPKAGAIVLFAGTTRDNFQGQPVKQLEYSSYVPRAVATLHEIASAVKQKHALTAVSVTHRLGVVPVGEESILIAVSAAHRQAAWRAGEEALEECKKKAEIWKLEEFEDEGNGDGDGDGANGVDGRGGGGGGVWRANRDD